MLISFAFYQTAQTLQSQIALKLQSLHCFVLDKSLLREFAEAHKYHSKPRFPSKVCMGSFCLAYLDWFASALYCVGSDLQSHEASPSCSWLEIGCWKLLGSLWPPETRQTAPAHLQIEKNTTIAVTTDDLYVISVKGQTMAMFTHKQKHNSLVMKESDDCIL